ncbi:MAG: Gfo/Idh/MocA family oxidoreductase [Rhodospirillales bacterium]|jgi:predicted dehydrogenase/threonine dehydrogenase-like Zn-dependent dehydrogenase|nr:Gfo/Idh/MocA family oxidoreductase [Rhodospirillales bacterium]
MKQVIQSARGGKLSVKDVPEPIVQAGHLLVRTRASLISAGTERMIVDFAQKSLAGKARARPDLVKKVLGKVKRDGVGATIRTVMAQLDQAIPLGYSAAGEVIAVGGGLEGQFVAGQRVCVAGAGLANHAEMNLVPANLAAPIPEGVADTEACYGTLGAIAMHAVRNAGAGLGDVVAVMGVGLLGQLAAQFLTLQGARVVVLDYDAERLKLALKLGAEAAINLGSDNVRGIVDGLSNGRGCDNVIISAASDSSEPFRVAADIARDRARIVMVGLTGTEFPYQTFMAKELNVIVSRSYGPGRYDPDFEGRGVKYPEGWVRWTETENLAEVARLLAPASAQKTGMRLNVKALTTHSFSISNAEAAYEMVTEQTEPHMGVVLTYDGEAREQATPVFATAKKAASDRCVMGVIGGGNFARAVLLPEFKRLESVDLHTIVTKRGISAEKTRETFGFSAASSDPATVLGNPDINAVLIATRHDSHADLTAQALAAGKSVLVEKPVALNREDLNRVIEARQNSDAFLQIGFNRRFAPHAVQARERLAAAKGSKFVLLRVNAGHIPAESWVQNAEEGGGRILGEVCHFVDLARFLVGAPIVSVQADAAQATDGPCDDLSASLRFADGSLATVAYTALGDASFSKELIEGYAGGSVVKVDNFRSISVAEQGNINTERDRMGQDKGFRDAVSAFAKAVIAGGPAPVDEAEIIETSLATMAVVESLREGRRIDL